MTDLLILIEQYPIWILFCVSIIGMRSHVWGKLSLIMFLVTGFNILNLEFNLIGWSSDIKYLAPFAIFFAGLSGIVVSWAKTLPDNISHKNKKAVLIASILIALLYVIEILMNFQTQMIFIYVFDSTPHPDHWSSIMHDVVMILATTIQVLILRKGGFDGVSRIIADIKDYSISHHYFTWHPEKNKIVSNRDEKIQ